MEIEKMQITRLEELKKELETINSLDCLAFNIKEEAQKYYEHEIECIEVYGLPNPVYNVEAPHIAVISPQRKFYNVDLKQ